MDSKLLVRVGTALAGLGLGMVCRVGLERLVGDEVVLLSALNLVGWFTVGILAGLNWQRRPWLRFFLAGLAAAAFTSWATLLLAGVDQGGQVLVAVLELAFGAFFAGLGLLLAFKIRPLLI